MFKLTKVEFENLRLQFATSSSRHGYGYGDGWSKNEQREQENEKSKSEMSGFERINIKSEQREQWGGRRHLPYVFTGYGVRELATILKWDLED